MAIFLRRRVGILGYVAEAGVLAQLSIQAIEDPNTPKEIYTQTHKHTNTTSFIGYRRSQYTYGDVLVKISFCIYIRRKRWFKANIIHCIRDIDTKVNFYLYLCFVLDSSCLFLKYSCNIELQPFSPEMVSCFPVSLHSLFRYQLY